jgi:hypothetical protein
MRITRLITDDKITQPARKWLEQKAMPQEGQPAPHRIWHWINLWATCPWCAGLWIAAAGSCAHHAWHHTTGYQYAVFALATAHLIGLAATWLDSPPPPRRLQIDPLYADVNLHQQTRPGN